MTARGDSYLKMTSHCVVLGLIKGVQDGKVRIA